MGNLVGMPPISEAKNWLKKFASLRPHIYHSAVPPAETLLLFLSPLLFASKWVVGRLWIASPAARYLEKLKWHRLNVQARIYLYIYTDRVGCLCAILELFARLFVGMRRSSHQRKFCLKYYWLFAPLWQPINLKCHWGWNLGPSANGGFINRGDQFLTSGWMTPKSRN